MDRTPDSRKKQLVRNSPVLLSALATGIYIFLFERGLLKETHNVFGYPLDDPFIHMDLAKNLVLHNTWGINSGEFASASSSILYPLLLWFCFKVTSINPLVPFIINCVAGFFLLTAINKWLARQKIGTAARCYMLLAVVIFAPLPMLIIVGMEHTLQCLFCFLFISSFSEFLPRATAAEKIAPAKPPLRMLLFALLVTSVRFEGIFLIGIACLMLLYYRKVSAAMLVGIVGFMPVIVFGIYSVSKGSYFFPNSVLVKSDSVPLSLSGVLTTLTNILGVRLVLFNTGIQQMKPAAISLVAAQRLLILLPVLYLLSTRVLKATMSYSYYLFILAACAFLHLCLAATGMFYRYESYLIVAALPIVFAILYRYSRQVKMDKPILSTAMIALLGFALISPYILRSKSAFETAKESCVNIFEQQYQSAQFLKKFYDKSVVAANDIGAISYYTDINLIDLAGLASIEVARSKKGGYCTPGFLDSLVRRKAVKLAIVYDDWFDKDLLSRWTKVGTWQIPNNVICGSSVVSFYVVNPSDKSNVAEHMREYRKELPADVKVAYF